MLHAMRMHLTNMLINIFPSFRDIVSWSPATPTVHTWHHSIHIHLLLRFKLLLLLAFFLYFPSSRSFFFSIKLYWLQSLITKQIEYLERKFMMVKILYTWNIYSLIVNNFQMHSEFTFFFCVNHWTTFLSLLHLVYVFFSLTTKFHS